MRCAVCVDVVWGVCEGQHTLLPSSRTQITHRHQLPHAAQPPKVVRLELRNQRVVVRRHPRPYRPLRLGHSCWKLVKGEVGGLLPLLDLGQERRGAVVVVRPFDIGRLGEQVGVRRTGTKQLPCTLSTTWWRTMSSMLREETHRKATPALPFSACAPPSIKAKSADALRPCATR